jgi:hypothetical protein
MKTIKAEVIVLKEKARHCGYRSPAKSGIGIYLMGSNLINPCERLPFPVHSCPTCGAGIKFARGWTWIIPKALFAANTRPVCSGLNDGSHNHELCPMCSPGEKPAGLVWIGDRYYNPTNFLAEAKEMGVSKKINALPHGFILGETLIYLGHPKAIVNYDITERKLNQFPGVFSVFKPDRIDLIIKDANKVPNKAAALQRRLGPKRCRIAVIEKDTGQGEMIETDENTD